MTTQFRTTTALVDTSDPKLREMFSSEHEGEDIAGLLARAERLRFDPNKEPPEAPPRFWVDGVAVATAGNLINLIAQAKAGKSACIGAIIAAVISAENAVEGVDTLGFRADKIPEGGILLHLDTEQSLRHHYDGIKRAMRRANCDVAPTWLHSYPLAGWGAGNLRLCLKAKLDEYKAAGAQVFAVLIDGTADMVDDINDLRECSGLVAELHGLAIEHQTVVVNVIHENPSAGNPRNGGAGKGRGHLGSQLERKAESNLCLKRTGEFTVIYGEKMRNAPIFEDKGPRFRWDDMKMMHVSCQSAGVEREEKNRATVREEMEDLFQSEGKERLRYTDLKNAICSAREIKGKTAEQRIALATKLGVIVKNTFSGEWSLARTP
jgi:hypothetical protein